MASRSKPLAFSPPGLRVAQRPSVTLPLMLVTVLFYLLLIPEQANFRVAGVLLSPYRSFLIPSFFYLLRGALAGNFRFAWPDIPIAIACGWIWVASYVTSSEISTAIVQGGAHTIDIALAYFVARFTIRSPRDLRVFLIMIAPGVAVMGGIVFLESISGRIILQPLLAQITGVPNRISAEVRMGLTRGAASFPHPILAGISLGSFLTLYWMSGIRGWPKFAGALGAIAGFFTMSSAALLALVAGAGLMVYDWLVLRINNLTWRLFLLGMAILYAVIELATQSGFFNLLVRFASLNSVSGYNRVLIWRFGSENVVKNPWFGIGYDDWERPSWMQWANSFSMDHFWLLQAVRFGLPVSLMLILATAGAVVLVVLQSTRLDPADARLLRGVAISLAVFALGAVSVALWLNALVWFFMLIGIAVSLATSMNFARPAQVRMR